MSAANSASYAGANVAQMALTLVNEQADEVVAQALRRLLPQRRVPAGRSRAPKKNVTSTS